MKTLRLILIFLGVAAAILLGAQEKILGGPILKGFDTHFSWQADPQNNRLILRSDPDGSMQCWIKMRVSSKFKNFTASTSQDTPLAIFVDGSDSASELIELVRDGQSREQAFEWPSGVSLWIYPKDQDVAGMMVDDWYVYPSNKSYDSRLRVQWRRIEFIVLLTLLGLAICGGLAEASERLRGKEEVVTPEQCVRSVIRAVEGADRKQTEQMRGILKKVLLEGAPLKQELSSLALGKMQTAQFLFALRGQVGNRLRRFIDDLGRYVGYLEK